jgi:hypothetical protein
MIAGGNMLDSNLIESTRQRLHVAMPPSTAALHELESVNTRLEVPLQQQEQTNWCWAAVTVTVFDFYRNGAGSPQCPVADLELGRQDCCPLNPQCNEVATLDLPLRRNGNFRDLQDSPATFPDVITEITNRRPLGCRVEWFQGGSHFLLVNGFADHPSGMKTIEIADTFYGPSTQNFDTFPADYQLRGTWTHTYFTKRSEV